MPATDLGDLEPLLNVELGGGVGAASQAVGTLDRINVLKAGVAAFNAEAPKAFTLTGTTLDREATATEQRLLVLFAAWSWVRGKAIENSAAAIVHSNVAGRTDLSGVEFALSKRAKEWRDEINRLLALLTGAAVATDVHAEELGETKEFAAMPHPYPYPIPYW